MLRICHLISGDLWAGAEVVLSHLLPWLRQFPDLDLRAIVLNEGRLAEKLREADVPVRVIEERKQSFFRLTQEIRKDLAREPADLLHSHRYKENVLAFLVRSADMVTVATQHGLPEHRHTAKQKFLFKGQLFLLAHRFDQVVGVSADLRHRLIRDFGLPARKVRVIHNGISIPRDWEEPSAGKEGPVVIGSCGRLTAIKDYPLMIETAREIRRHTDQVRFVLAGEGPERGRLEELIRRAGLRDVFTLAGHIADMPRFYRGLGVYMNTSLHEGMPMSILEAMSHGLPVIAPRVGGIGEIIDDGIEGFLLRERHPAVFAQASLRLLRNEGARAAFSRAARDKVLREFSAEGMAGHYHNLYREIVAGRAWRGTAPAVTEKTGAETRGEI